MLRSRAPRRGMAGYLAGVLAPECSSSACSAVFLSGNRVPGEFRDGNGEAEQDFHIISIILILRVLSDYG